MAHKKVLNQKIDFWDVNKANRQRDIEVLEMAKQMERKKQLKTVRIDTRTIISVEADKCTEKHIASIVSKLNEYREKYY